MATLTNRTPEQICGDLQVLVNHACGHRDKCRVCNGRCEGCRDCDHSKQALWKRTLKLYETTQGRSL